MKKILIGILMILGSITYSEEVQIPKNRMTGYPFVKFERINVSDYKEKPIKDVKVTIDTIIYQRKNMNSDHISKNYLSKPFILNKKINTVTNETTENFQTNQNGIAQINKKIEFGDRIKDLDFKGAFYSAKFDRKVTKIIVIIEKNGYISKKISYEGKYPNVLNIRLKNQLDNNLKGSNNILLENHDDSLKIFKNIAIDNNFKLKKYSEVKIKNKNYTTFYLDYSHNFKGTQTEFNNYIIPLLEYSENLIYVNTNGIVLEINEKNGDTYKYLIRKDILTKYNSYELSAIELYLRVIRIKNGKRLN